MTELSKGGEVGNAQHTFAILAYKESPYLEECIKSLKKQTVESRLVMATSTPSPFLDAMSRNYDIPIVVNERSEGIAADWSFAYNACSTEYVTLAHQDDVYAPQYTEECLAAAGKHAGNLIVFTGSSELAEGLPRQRSLNLLVKKAILGFFYFGRERIISPLLKKRLLAFGNPIACPAVMFHREKIGHFEFSRELAYNLDWDAWLRLSQHEGDFVYVKKALMSHRIHRDSALVRGTADESRKREDALLFGRFWPAPLDRMIAMVYVSLSYRANLKGGNR